MNTLIEIRVGSDSDLPRIEKAFAALEALQVPFEVRVLSAHRTPACSDHRRPVCRLNVNIACSSAASCSRMASSSTAVRHKTRPPGSVALRIPCAGFVFTSPSRMARL